MRLPSPRSPLLAATALAVAALAVSSAHGQISGLDTRLIGSGFTQPVFATAPLADGRVFVVEKGGTIKAVQGGVTTNFLSLAVNSSSEQGLLGLAFDPQYGLAGANLARLVHACEVLRPAAVYVEDAALFAQGGESSGSYGRADPAIAAPLQKGGSSGSPVQDRLLRARFKSCDIKS